MSLIIAQVHQNHALLVTDTRGTVENRPVTDEITKVYPLPRGGFIASGPGAAWGESLYTRLKSTDGSLSEIIAASKEWAPKAMLNLEAIERINPAARGASQLVLSKQTSFVIGSDGEGLYAATLDWSGQNVQVYRAGQVVMAGPESLSSVFGGLQDDYCFAVDNLLDRLSYVSDQMAIAGALLRVSAFFCCDVFERCGQQGNVGPNMEAGVIVQTAPTVFVPFSLGRTPQQAVLDSPRPDRLLVERLDQMLPSVLMHNNLAFVRAQSLRLARREAAERGLGGRKLDEFLAARVDADVRASIDPATGASRLPEAREFASLPTFSSPLVEGTLGKSIEKIVQDHPWLTPVMPFVRTSFNVLDYTFKRSTPLGLLSSNMRETIARGGPEAAILQTRMAVGTTLWSMAGLMAFSGSITGRGPTDPRLRQMWLANHQPYSIKFGDEWVSYRRLEPFATMLGVTADLAHILRDNTDDLAVQQEGSQVWYAILASTITGVTNKTYLSGLVKFMDAIGSGDGPSVKAFIDQTVGAAVPNLLAGFNNDPYLRQTRGLFDALLARTPWSGNLPAKYNVFGEPLLSEPGRIERNLNPFPTKDAGPSTEDEFLDLDRAFVPPPTYERFGNLVVNLHDRKYESRKGGKLTPYERLMEIVQSRDLRGQVDRIIASPAYQRAGDGTDVFAGGRRYVEIRGRIDRVYAQSRRQLLSEYPELKRELVALNRARRASGRSDRKGEGLLGLIGR